MPKFQVRYSEILDETGEPVLWLEDNGACGDPECCGQPSYNIAMTPEFRLWLESFE